MSVCAGCGAPLPPSRSSRPRKWCSERCRKTQYSTPCVDCGAPTGGSDGRGPNAPRRCKRCATATNGERGRARFAERKALIERLWAEGKTAREIGAIVGWSRRSPNSAIAVLRARGYNLPHRRTPEQLARMLAGADERMARMRVLRSRSA